MHVEEVQSSGLRLANDGALMLKKAYSMATRRILISLVRVVLENNLPNGFNHFSFPVPMGKSRMAKPSLHPASSTILLCAFVFSSSTSSSSPAPPNALPYSRASTTTVRSKKFKSEPKGGHLSPMVSAGESPTTLFPFFPAPLAVRLRRLLCPSPLSFARSSRACSLASPAAYVLEPTTGTPMSSASLRSAS